MNDFLKEIGRSYIVSSLLPAAMFLPLGLIVFYDFIPNSVIERIIVLNIFWGQNWLFFLIAVSWIGFLLYSSFQSIIDLFLGDWLPKKLKEKMCSRCEKYYAKMLESYYLACSQIKDISDPSVIETLIILRPIALSELASLGLSVAIPLSRSNVSPTLIGNVFQSSAVYIKDRYNIDGNVMWPRLIHVFPAPFLKNLEEKNNYFLFLLNSSLLAGIIGVISLLLGIIKGILEVIRTSGNAFSLSYLYSSFELIGAACLFFLGFYLFYRLATNAAEDYSQIVCSGFDLYRRDLLMQIGLLSDENDLLQEKQLWGVLSEYMIAGNTLGLADINFVIKRTIEKNT